MRSSIYCPFAALLLTLQACGGGGGGAAETVAAVPVAVAPASAPDTTVRSSGMAGLLPAAGMTWATDQNLNLRLTVRDAAGKPAAGAAVRVFTLSRLSPQDGSALEEPVPMSLLDSGATDSLGILDWVLRLPAHQTDLLLVATAGPTLGQVVIKASAATLSADLALSP
ncbi:hypothetical protein [Roseateles albus]|uniref:Uncharacterized protein n=1 Tax=Roseateles albus TaxID=2987525 RepID=A0ABT5KGE0_9BURK|nr:hypothetical protein [Roseateles albus]MDC8772987.1 hypothetical protein [Roseateles albus]